MGERIRLPTTQPPVRTRCIAHRTWRRSAFIDPSPRSRIFHNVPPTHSCKTNPRANLTHPPLCFSWLLGVLITPPHAKPRQTPPNHAITRSAQNEPNSHPAPQKPTRRHNAARRRKTNPLLTAAKEKVPTLSAVALLASRELRRRPRRRPRTWRSTWRRGGTGGAGGGRGAPRGGRAWGPGGHRG